MSLIGWLKRGKSKHETRRRQWREIWVASIEAENGPRVDELRAQLQTLQTKGDDVEMELEMLDALERLSHLRADADAAIAACLARRLKMMRPTRVL